MKTAPATEELNRLATTQLAALAAAPGAALEVFRRSIEQADDLHPRLDLGGHSARVSAVTFELCLGLDYTTDQARHISEAAYYHDIGKLALPPELLLAERTLTASEQQKVALHADIGADLLANAGADLAAEIARLHHKPFAGALKPTPLAVCIVSVADAYDAIRSQRPYKPALTHEEVMSALLDGDHRTRCGAFDPAVLTALAKDQFAISQAWDCAQLKTLSSRLRHARR
jgi:putative two-component system response regulator